MWGRATAAPTSGFRARRRRRRGTVDDALAAPRVDEVQAAVERVEGERVDARVRWGEPWVAFGRRWKGSVDEPRGVRAAGLVERVRSHAGAAAAAIAAVHAHQVQRVALGGQTQRGGLQRERLDCVDAAAALREVEADDAEARPHFDDRLDAAACRHARRGGHALGAASVEHRLEDGREHALVVTPVGRVAVRRGRRGRVVGAVRCAREVGEGCDAVRAVVVADGSRARGACVQVGVDGAAEHRGRAVRAAVSACTSL